MMDQKLNSVYKILQTPKLQIAGQVYFVSMGYTGKTMCP